MEPELTDEELERLAEKIAEKLAGRDWYPGYPKPMRPLPPDPYGPYGPYGPPWRREPYPPPEPDVQWSYQDYKRTTIDTTRADLLR